MAYTEAQAAVAKERLAAANSDTKSSASRFVVASSFGEELVEGLGEDAPAGFAASVPRTKSSASVMTVTTERAKQLNAALDAVSDG